MTQEIAGNGPMTEYLGRFAGLIGDKRTGETFREVVRGTINAGSLICQRIAAHSALLSDAKDGGQRVIRFAKGGTTKRSQIDAEHLVDVLCQLGVERLAASDTDELWLIADPSDLRKPYASEMPDLMQVRDLDGKLVPGYRTLNVLGMTPGRRGILYHLDCALQVPSGDGSRRVHVNFLGNLDKGTVILSEARRPALRKSPLGSIPRGRIPAMRE